MKNRIHPVISQTTGAVKFHKFLVSIALCASLISSTGCGAGGSSNPAETSKPSSSASSVVTKTAESSNKSVASATQKASSKVVGDRLSGPTDTSSLTPKTAQEPSPFRFTEITKESGIDFVHVSGMDEKRYFPTANGSGVAMFDADGDGLLDLYFLTNCPLPVDKSKAPSNKFYKNLGNGKFEDLTAVSGLGYRGFSHGAITGDIDKDGDADLFLATYEDNRLYRNNGKGVFEDITEKAGIKSGNYFSSGGAMLDFDNDGDLDIYVSNYGQWDLKTDDVFCGDTESKLRYYCSPRSIRTVSHLLYRNNGNGTFTDVAKEAGVGRSDGHGFGVVTADLNGDGKVDIYVANDMNPNFLFLNKGDGTFEDATEFSGAAFDIKGQAQSGMGLDAEDFDGDGNMDLFVTNFANEYNTLYQNMNNNGFYDITTFVGLATDSMPMVGWGCALMDFDNDSWPDCFVTNGHVDSNRAGVPYEQLPLIWANIPVAGKDYVVKNTGVGAAERRKRKFRIATRDVGPYFEAGHVGRGAAFGDLDNDGDIDIVVNHKDSAPSILRNDTPAGKNHWIRLDLKGTKSNTDAINTRVEIELEPGRLLSRQVKGGGSMLSVNDRRLLIGLGEKSPIVKARIFWPSGIISDHAGLDVNKSHVITEPAGQSAAEKAKSSK
jgi:hypothetical protein